MKKTILITGGAGYVGSVTTRYLLSRGYSVVVIDRLSFGGGALVDLLSEPDFEFHRTDLNDFDAVAKLVASRSFFAVLHLAAIVGDPACRLDPVEARRTNWDAAVHLFECSVECGVDRFVFASTCSNYGKMADPSAFVDEQSTLNPVSLYAKLKVEFEEYIFGRGSSETGTAPTALRFSTVYGLSPRMRFDLTVNEFTRDVVLGRPLEIYGKNFWRPYCHVRDFARAYECVLEAPREVVLNESFNIGETTENYTKQMLADELLRLDPDAEVSYVSLAEDPRDYRVNADKAARQLGFRVSRRVPDGIREIADALSSGLIEDPWSARYSNVPVGETG